MIGASTPVELFCSYAHEDERWLQKLETHLSLLKRQGLISFWHDRLIAPGADWAKTLDAHLETASVILLLVSAHFLASDYCYGTEMKRALERQEAGEARVVPILVRPVDWKDAPFAYLQALPTDAKPLASWRDEDRALADVAAGIRRVIEDVPLLAASAPRANLPAIWNVPYQRNPFFLGRDDELTQLRSHLQVGQATALSQPQAISGLGGIGKTQLALEYAYRYHRDYQAVLWARAESTEILVSSYVTIAALLRLPEREAKEQDIIVQAVKTWLQTHRSWLLILDNADELTLIPDFLPPSLGGHLLLTTRAAATGQLAHRMEIETLLPEQGALFLLRRAGLIAPDTQLSQASSQERELALRVSRELGSLPLALDQAGAYLEETGIDLAGYWHIYQQRRADLLRNRRGLVADHPEPVATTWSVSFQRVEERKPAAADLLRLCAYLAPDAIPQEILTAGASQLGPVLAPVAVDPFLFDQAIEALRAYSLMRRDPREKSLSIHRLVQATLQDRLEETQQRLWAERAVRAVNAAFPHVEYSTWPQCERLLPQALTAAQVIKQYQILEAETGRLLYETGCYLRARAQNVQAEPLFQQALQIREQVLGSRPRDTDTADILHDLAWFYLDQRDYKQAAPLYQRAFDIRKRELGANPKTAYTLSCLARVYREQDQYQQAEPLLEAAEEIFNQVSGAKDANTASILHYLAWFFKDMGQYTQSEELFQQALQIREQASGVKDADRASTLHDLAWLYLDQRKYMEAEPLFQQALQIRKQILHEHPDTASTLHALAWLYKEQREYEQAESLLKEALSIREQVQRPEHPDIADALHALGKLYDEQRQYEQAEPLFQRVLRIREQALGPKHPETAEIVYDLARLRESQGNSEEARAWYARALAIREQTLGAHHPKTAETRKHFIALLHALGQPEEATQLEATQAES